MAWGDLAEARRAGDELGSQLDTSDLRGVPHSILLADGGASFGDHDPNASITVQLEDDQRHGPRLVLELTIDDIPHEAYLDLAEAAALRHLIAQLLNNTGR